MSEQEHSVAAEADGVPRLKVVGMHIRGLRAIRQLDLPRDGLGWQGQMPDLVLLAGINGSGKTTLLNLLVDCLALITRSLEDNFDPVLPPGLAAQEVVIAFDVECREIPLTRLRFIIGDEGFVNANKTENCWWILRVTGGGGFHGRQGNTLIRMRNCIDRSFHQSTIPSVVFLPSENRALTVPGASYKAAGKLADDQSFVHRWKPPQGWQESLEALLYGLRWEDLNAREEGRTTDADHFSSYANAFRQIIDQSKSLQFEGGKLVVKVPQSTVAHDLGDLSSGERQLLLICGELLRYWRPGSLILIDEPEMHLHPHWQTRLYEALRRWQKERGGQVILATQSVQFVDLAGPGTAAPLGVEPL